MKVKQQWLSRNIHHNDVIDVDILYDTASSSTALEPEADIGSEEAAVRYPDVLDTTGHLTSDNETSVTMEYDTIVNYQITAWSCPPAAVLILSRFNAYGIVSDIKA